MSRVCALQRPAAAACRHRDQARGQEEGGGGFGDGGENRQGSATSFGQHCERVGDGIDLIARHIPSEDDGVAIDVLVVGQSRASQL